jgi:hypothetical protein
MKNIFLFGFFLVLVGTFVNAVDCPEGQTYDSYWQKCQNLCNNYQEWDFENEVCKNKDYVEESYIKGYVLNFTGTVLIERGLDLISPSYNEPFYEGDVIFIEKGSTAVLKSVTSDKFVTVSGKKRIPITNSKKVLDRTSKITLFFGNIWFKMKKVFSEEDSDYTYPTAVAGVRG